MSDSMTTTSSPDASADEIKTLRARVKQLETELSDAAETLRETRHEARDRRLELKQLRETHDALTAEHSTLKARADAEPNEVQTRLDGALATIRGLRHESAFAAVAKSLKVSDPSRLADLVALAKYAPTADEPDQDAIKSAFETALKGRPYLLDPAETATRTAADAATQTPGGATVTTTTTQGPAPGASRGVTPTETDSTPRKRIPGRI